MNNIWISLFTNGLASIVCIGMGTFLLFGGLVDGIEKATDIGIVFMAIGTISTVVFYHDLKKKSETAKGENK